MSSTAAVSATAIQVISVQDLYYGNEVNPGIAIFTLLASQLVGYAFAGLLQEALVYPSVAYWPTTIVPANMFQALHFDGGLGSKRTRMFWGLRRQNFPARSPAFTIFSLGLSAAALCLSSEPVEFWCC